MNAAPTGSSGVSAHTGLDRVLADITAEREAQHAAWGVQHLPHGTGPQWLTLTKAARQDCEQAAVTGRLTWRHILIEEVAEALAEYDLIRLRGELVQGAAVASGSKPSITLCQQTIKRTLNRHHHPTPVRPTDSTRIFNIVRYRRRSCVVQNRTPVPRR